MNKTSKISILGSMSALAIILIAFVNFPIFPSASFLRYDPGDIPIILCALLFGYRPALSVAAVVAIIQGLLLSHDGGIIGMVMHFLATGSFVLLAGLVYEHTKGQSRLAMALASGSLAMVVMMVLLNLIAIPLFLGVNIEIVYELLVPVIIPFNLVKVIINSLVVAFIFPSLQQLIKSKY